MHLAIGFKTVWRICTLLVGASVLAGCGFEPLYGRGGAGQDSPVAAALADIRIAPIANRPGQILRNQLEERLTPLGEPARPNYTLSVTLEESIEKLVFRRDASPTRANMTLVANYRLKPANADQPVTTGTARTVVGYNISGAEFATLVAEGDARERALREIALQITSRLASHFAQTTAKR